jgi:GGDEF domain-containing protein
MTDSLFQVPPQYESFLQEVTERIRSAQVRAALSVNWELIQLYWSIGRNILNRQNNEGWGAKVIDRLSDKTDLPNRRAFDEGKASPWVAISDVNGLKALNDEYGYSAGDALIRWFAEVLVRVGLDAYHDKGDEFLCKGKSYQDLNNKLSKAQRILRQQPFPAVAVDGRITTIAGADFCFGIGIDLKAAEVSLKHQKELRKASR